MPIKKSVSISLILIILFAIFLIRFDIISDLDKLKQRETNAGNELQMYHDNLSKIDSLIGKEQYVNAISFIDAVLIGDSIYASSYIFEKGKIYYELGRFHEAKSAFTISIEKSGDYNLNSRVWRAYTFAELGDCDSAMIDVTYAKNQNSTFENDYNRLKHICTDR